jgi:acyl-ACP thioesterase
MEKVGSFHYHIDTQLADYNGQLSLPMLVNQLIQSASKHALQRGFGFEEMQGHNSTWVLSRLVIEMESFPSLDDTLTIRTWVEEVARLFTNRCFALSNATGQTIGYARSIWAAIDVETRRPTDLSQLIDLSNYIHNEPCPIDKPGKVQPAEQETAGEPYTVRYSDLDINGHLTSYKYVEHLLNLFDLDWHQHHAIQRFEIAYMAEGRYGMQLSFHKKEIAPKHYVLAICDAAGKPICRAAVHWKEKQIEINL